MGTMVYSLLWVMQDVYHQPYRKGVVPGTRCHSNPPSHHRAEELSELEQGAVYCSSTIEASMLNPKKLQTQNPKPPPTPPPQKKKKKQRNTRSLLEKPRHGALDRGSSILFIGASYFSDRSWWHENTY